MLPIANSFMLDRLSLAWNQWSENTPLDIEELDRLVRATERGMIQTGADRRRGLI
ncbi:hypothetical protein [Acuticoccus kandeliae]|uniref:hypothetical protein n=1 Tax=Acuticoccus kandeliae TaxID=2073160 RepID=UPI001300BA66|nr:hypothetical protein [Acuticoccus kandeliae]